MSSMTEFPYPVPPPDEMRRMSASELNGLPFGVLELDEEGTIVRINEPEARRTHREPEAFLGLNFFDDVAPCTNVREFADEFREGARRGYLDEVFRFVYPLDDGPQRVIVYLRSSVPGYGWVMATIRPA